MGVDVHIHVKEDQGLRRGVQAESSGATKIASYSKINAYRSDSSLVQSQQRPAPRQSASSKRAELS